MSGWADLEGFDAWSRELEKLLATAEKAAQQTEFDKRLAVAKKLNEFIQFSRPDDADVRRLDDLAAATSVALMQQSIDERLAEITMRTAEYLKLAKEVASATATANDQADSIRLKSLTGAIEAATQAIESVKKLEDVLGDSAADQKLAQAVTEAIAAFEALRSRAGKLL